jgi:tetratricopeptide (TPR) repeat protein
MRFEELAALCDERAAKDPEDVRVWRARARLESSQRRWKEATTVRRHVIDLGKGDEDDYNQIAWEGLFRDERTAQTVEAAEHAALFRNQPSWGHLHTLAAVYADVGRVVEARQTLIKELDARGFAEPGPQEWLVIGRLAAQYGANEHALAAYQRVTKPKTEADVAGSSYELAQRWMSQLHSVESGAKPAPPAQKPPKRK